jgi:DNA-binding XRE family transcriptional regulator
MSTKILTTKDIEKAYGPLTFGSLLRAHREADELPQVQMAKKIRISKQALNDIENGRRIPSVSRAVAIAKKIGILPELAVELVLQDQINREKLKMVVIVRSEKKAA